MIRTKINKESITKIVGIAKEKAKNEFFAMPVKNRIGIGAYALSTVVLCSVLAFSHGAGMSGSELSAEAKAAAQNTESYYAVMVDGKAIVAVADKTEAQAVLDAVTTAYQTPGSELINVAYTEKVDLAEVSGEDAKPMAKEDAVTMILTGTKEPKTYTVQSGDSFWTIAHDNGMKISELAAANPTANADCLKIGTALNLFEVKPYIHLTLTERSTTSEQIAYGLSYEKTDTLYKGETCVKVAGTYGEKQVTKETVKQNAAVVSTKEIASTIISEPKPSTVLQGTKSLSSLVGTGNFSAPVGHIEVSSAFGSRGSGRHTGVDLRNPKGTPIHVVDDGVVTHASYQGSYGNLVIVSHGNGIVTYYGHCDTMNVAVGDVVRKGDQIATVGITGRATGYHLHFEVRKDGTPQNPMNYL